MAFRQRSRIMFEVPIREIPRDSSLVIDVELTAEQLTEMFAQVEDFEPGPPEKFEARVRTQRIGDGIRLAGYVASTFVFRCGRCLEQREIDVEGDLEYMLIARKDFEGRYGAGASNDPEDDEDGLGLSVEDLDVDFYEGEELDVRPYLREVLMLELPTLAICPQELSQECQRDYEANVGAEALEENEEGGIDPRWSKLLELKKKQESN